MAKPYGLANRKSCYLQMHLDEEKPEEQEQMMNTDPVTFSRAWIPLDRINIPNPNLSGFIVSPGAFYLGSVLGQDASESLTIPVERGTQAIHGIMNW